MKKQSSLKALLRYKSVLEQKHQVCLERANAAVEWEVEKLQRLEQAKLNVELERSRKLRSGISGAELMSLSTEALEAGIDVQQIEIDRARLEQAKARSAYVLRRSERETVQSALEQKELEISKEIDRREQASTDDTTLQRFARSGRNSR